VTATIKNKPGQAGSLAVYAALALRHGRIDAVAAREGLALFAEHTADAQAHPGRHPNIDRLLQVLASDQGTASGGSRPALSQGSRPGARPGCRGHRRRGAAPRRYRAGAAGRG